MGGENTFSLDTDFKEGDHPRADNGQFGSSSGGKSSKSKKPRLSSKEKWALESYADDHFLEVNSKLREGDDSDTHVGYLDSAIAKSSIPEGTTLYRKITRDAAKQLFGAEVKAGSIVRDKAFSSTSSSKDFGSFGNFGGVLLKIETGPNAKGIDMTGFNNNPHEKEILLPRNAPLEITGITPPPDKAGQVIVHMRYRGEENKANDSWAFDKSLRRIDADGRLHVERSHISKAQVSPYYGREIPGFEELGLDPDKVYQLLRDPAELEKAAPTFARLQILKEHVPVTVKDPQPELVVGAIGSDIVFESPYLYADLSFWDAEAIAGIESDQVRELSCAYRYVPVMEPGEYEGKPFDGRMTQIQGNHLALVESGRAGSDVIVADSNPFTFEELTMKMTRLGRALFAVLGGLSPKLAMDAALGAIVGNAEKKTFNAKQAKEKLLALDATLNPEQLDGILDAIIGVEDDPKPAETSSATLDQGAVDASPVEQMRQLLAGKVDEETMNAACALLPQEMTGDEFPPKKEGEGDGKEEPGMKKEEVKAAMDSLRKGLREAAEAARDVRPIVGDVIGMDSAAEVYGFALDHMKVDRKDVTGVPALRALFRVASNRKEAAPVIAQDSAGLDKRFPNAARFGIA